MSRAAGAIKRAARRTGCASSEEWRARRTAGLKWCSAHRAWVPVDQFGRDAQRSDKKSINCRKCNAERTIAARRRKNETPRGTMPVTGRQASLERSLEEHAVPQHLRASLIGYVLDGHPVGGFLRSCLENNFVDAITRAGADLTVEDVRSVGKWIFNDAPPQSWGSPGVVKTWRGSR